METLWWLLSQILWLIWSVLTWLVGYLLWLAFWVLAPVILMAIVAVRVAEYVLGPQVVRAWVKRISLKFGAGAWRRTHRLLFALGVMPIRVLGWTDSTWVYAPSCSLSRSRLSQMNRNTSSLSFLSDSKRTRA